MGGEVLGDKGALKQKDERRKVKDFLWVRKTFFTGGNPSRKEDFEGMKRFGYMKKDTKVQSLNQFGIHAFSSQPEPMVLI